jgi:hypothetical protein
MFFYDYSLLTSVFSPALVSDQLDAAGNGFQLLHVPERFILFWRRVVNKISVKSSAVKMQAKARSAQKYKP